MGLILLASCNQVQQSNQQQLQQDQTIKQETNNQEDQMQTPSEIDEAANELSDSFIDESDSIVAGDLI